MATPQRKLHPLEGIVAVFALFFVLALTVGFAQAQTQKVVLRSASALVLDADTGEVVYNKNSDAVVPIASITKLMTAMVLLDADLPLEEIIYIDSADLDLVKHTNSRLAVGTGLPRRDMLRLALMSSENRAAASLARSYPGGNEAFIAAMNRKGVELGMWDTRFVDSTGLSSENVSTAEDLVKMVKGAYQYPLIREFTTTSAHEVETALRGRPATSAGWASFFASSASSPTLAPTATRSRCSSGVTSRSSSWCARRPRAPSASRPSPHCRPTSCCTRSKRRAMSSSI